MKIEPAGKHGACFFASSCVFDQLWAVKIVPRYAVTNAATAGLFVFIHVNS